MNNAIDEAKLKSIQKTSNLVGAASLIIFIILIAFSARELYSINSEIDQLKSSEQDLERKVSASTVELENLRPQVSRLKAAQENLLDFLAQATSGGEIKLLSISDSEWARTKEEIISLPPGQRQKAVLGAILLAWKDIPFKLGGKTLGGGLDSTTFVKFVISKAGIEIPNPPDRRPSDVMMQLFTKVESPAPGDVMFYTGKVGSFSLIYLAKGRPGGQGICIGTFETGQPVQILDSSDLNTTDFPFKGYYRVNYSS